jgi:NAD(P)H-hydrate epimerase
MTNQSSASPIQAITPTLLRAHPLRQFTDDASKADYGKLLIVGGSARLLGAALLCARAALRAGCGTVRLAAPQSVASVLGAACPELMMIPLPETKRGTVAKGAAQVLVEQWPPCDAAVIGPGLDEDDETLEISRSFVKWCPLPTVVDASAIAAASTCDFAGLRVVTPHPGEMKSLVDDFEPETGEQTARDWAASRNAVLVLKGRATIIASPGGEAWRNTAGTRGLGTAGSGDVLAGIIGALLAQGNAPELAAMYGVHLHALAGEDAARERGDDGMMASDFLERLPFVRREMEREARRR